MIAPRRRFGSSAALALVTLLYGVPLLYMVATSLKSRVQVFDAPESLLFRPTIDTYRRLIDDQLLHAARNSLTIATGSTVVVVLLATPLAFWLARVRGLVLTVGVTALILLQMVPQANTVIPLFRVLARFHLLGSTWGVVLANAALLLPFATILLRPFFVAVPREVHEAARIDGAGPTRVLWAIAVPLARNGLVTVATLVWIISWGEFLYAITFLGDRQRPLSAVLGSQVGQFGVEWEGLMAMAVVVTAPVLLLFVLTERKLTAGLTLGAGK